MLPVHVPPSLIQQDAEARCNAQKPRLEMAGVLRTVERLDPEGGGGFNPRIRQHSTWASAPEIRWMPLKSPVPHPFHSFIVKWVGNHEVHHKVSHSERSALQRRRGTCMCRVPQVSRLRPGIPRPPTQPEPEIFPSAHCRKYPSPGAQLE